MKTCNRILTEKDVFNLTGFNPVGKIKCRVFLNFNLYILSDVFDYLQTLLPYKHFEPEIEDGYYILESKMNND